MPDPLVHAPPVVVRCDLTTAVASSPRPREDGRSATGRAGDPRLLVDAHEVTRRGVATVLAADPHIRVVGEAESEDQARRRVLAVRPDVAVVADAQLCADLRSALPGMRCLVLEQDVSPEAVSAAIRAGASGYLVKDVRSTELVAAVRRVAAGHTCSPRRRSRCPGRARRSPPEPADDAHRPGAPIAAAARRGPQQQRDRRAPRPGGQDSEELRQPPACEAAAGQLARRRRSSPPSCAPAMGCAVTGLQQPPCLRGAVRGHRPRGVTLRAEVRRRLTSHEQARRGGPRAHTRPRGAIDERLAQCGA